MTDCAEFGEALSIIKANSFGNVWLIGGMVYRTIANQLYGTPRPNVDFDFIIEKSVSINDFNLPQGWNVGYNHFGNPKLIGPAQDIDFVPLENVYSIKHRNLVPSIDAYLTGAPLNIQSIAFDVQNKTIVGDIGMKALTQRIVEINDIYYAKYASEEKGTSLREYISKYAKELNFIPVYPDGV